MSKCSEVLAEAREGSRGKRSRQGLHEALVKRPALSVHREGWGPGARSARVATQACLLMPFLGCGRGASRKTQEGSWSAWGEQQSYHAAQAQECLAKSRSGPRPRLGAGPVTHGNKSISVVVGQGGCGHKAEPKGRDLCGRVEGRRKNDLLRLRRAACAGPSPNGWASRAAHSAGSGSAAQPKLAGAAEPVVRSPTEARVRALGSQPRVRCVSSVGQKGAGLSAQQASSRASPRAPVPAGRGASRKAQSPWVPSTGLRAGGRPLAGAMVRRMRRRTRKAPHGAPP